MSARTSQYGRVSDSSPSVHTLDDKLTFAPPSRDCELQCSNVEGQQYVCTGDALQTLTNVLNYLKVQKVDFAKVFLKLSTAPEKAEELPLEELGSTLSAVLSVNIATD
ncbi:hypothetical protein JOM56_003028 [Amanita muscaria]